jgi:hypothetical protein
MVFPILSSRSRIVMTKAEIAAGSSIWNTLRTHPLRCFIAWNSSAPLC